MTAQISLEENLINYGGLKTPAILETAPTLATQGTVVVKKGTNDEDVVETSADNELTAGVINEGTDPIDGPALAAADRVTVYKTGNIVWLRCTGTVAVLDELMSAASGRVKVRGAVAGTIYNVIAIALSAGVADDWIPGELVKYTVNTATT